MGKLKNKLEEVMNENKSLKSKLEQFQSDSDMRSQGIEAKVTV